ncbi:alpha/beta fold hydrolase [Acinetobacter sp. ANC 7454]|uniref:alpha/beta fold hydrolase n=1 Tax=Acinetobacter thermotolerans TaxID=3151487 RepID=UPI00325A5C18
MIQLKQNLQRQRKKLKHLGARFFNSSALVLSQKTPFVYIKETELYKVRHYPAPERQFKEPLVFVAPLAINMDIYDLYPYRSLVKHFQHSGFEVYLVEWNRFSFKHRELNFLSFIDQAIPEAIERIYEHSESDYISLHGWSMAGIFVTLYTALHSPEHVKNLMVMGSPIDSYTSGRVGKLFEATNKLISQNPAIRDTVHKGLIPKHYIHTPGILNAIGFKLLDPVGWFKSQKQFLLNLEKPEHVYEHATMGNFLNKMIDYPGGINQDMVLNLWLQNPLKHGSITLEDKKIELKNISCSLMVGAGDRDQIVTRKAAEPLTKLTSSKDVTFTLIPGGHLGLMSNQKTANTFWPKLSIWLEQRSTRLEQSK